MKDNFIENIIRDSALFRHARGVSIESGKEFHSYNEIILFIDGDAEFISEDIHTHLYSNSIIFIPKETYHQLIVNKDPNNYYRCVINFHTRVQTAPFLENSLTKPMIIPLNKSTEYIFERLKASIYHPCAGEILNASITMLLCELESCKETNVVAPQSELVRKAVTYVNKHINQSITVKEIANYCNVSLSLLSHIFKKEMNISPYKYTVKKRLVNARRKIMEGEPSTSVAIECGWGDYSGFYKQYLKTFGKPPSTK